MVELCLRACGAVCDGETRCCTRKRAHGEDASVLALRSKEHRVSRPKHYCPQGVHAVLLCRHADRGVTIGHLKSKLMPEARVARMWDLMQGALAYVDQICGRPDDGVAQQARAHENWLRSWEQRIGTGIPSSRSVPSMPLLPPSRKRGADGALKPDAQEPSTVVVELALGSAQLQPSGLVHWFAAPYDANHTGKRAPPLPLRPACIPLTYKVKEVTL